MIVHTTEVVGPLDVVSVDGFRCSSATRTLIDMAALDRPPVRLEAAIDSAVRLGLSSPWVVSEHLATMRGPGRHGARLLDRLLIDSGGESLLERRFLALLRRAGLPRPTTQLNHRRNGRHVARADFCFEPDHLVIEVTGRVGHSSPLDRARDARRRNELIDLGRRVFEYTWADITERPGYVLATMRSRLRAAGWSRGTHVEEDDRLWSARST